MTSAFPSLQGFLGQSLGDIATFQYYTTAAIALFYYEYLITVSREVRFAWRKRLSAVSVLFLLLRYITLFAYVPTLLFVTSAPDNNKACTAFAHFPAAMYTISLGIITSFLILRTYAIYFGHVWVLVVTIPPGIANVVLASWALTKVRTYDLTFGTGPLRTCVPAILESESPFKASWAVTIVFDTLVSVLTICKTYRMHHENRRVGVESRLTEMLLHDGSQYYSVMTVANVLNFALFWVLAPTFNYIAFSAGNSSEITHAISVIIVCRMMLNVMEAANPRGGQNEASDDHTEGGLDASSLHFTSDGQHSLSTNHLGLSV